MASKNAATDEPTRRRDKQGWKDAKVHAVVLNSGVEVDITIPNLPLMIKTGQIPNDLVELALGVMQGTVKVTAEMTAEQADFFAMLVSKIVVDPPVEPEDYADLPYEDVEMLVEIGTRQRDLDALGRHIGGLHTSAEFRRFRSLDGFDTPLEGV